MVLRTVSPIDGRVVAEIEEFQESQIKGAVEVSKHAFSHIQQTPLSQRIQWLNRFLELLDSCSDEAAKELTVQMGRPLKHAPIEISTAIMRSRYMISVAETALSDDTVEHTESYKKVIKKVPVGPTLVIFAWNYPYLILVNSLIPALLAGNSLLIKPSPQTPAIADRVVELLRQAGLPQGVVQAIHCGNQNTLEKLIQNREIKLVCFTGSVQGGRAVSKAASERFIHVGLELGGKDPAYIRDDADLDYTAEGVVDGALFNSGQSCCSIERVYVHKTVAGPFIERVKKLVSTYTVGDPFDASTMLGPVISERSAQTIQEHIKDAIHHGAKSIVNNISNAKLFPTFVSPCVLVDVNHSMRVMTEETFGPVIPIQVVESDEEAIQLMNDSIFGLTASVWTKDEVKGEDLCDRIEAGSTFVNRADYPDPVLVWTGWKESGRGQTLSKYGFDLFTKLKSLHVKVHH